MASFRILDGLIWHHNLRAGSISVLDAVEMDQCRNVTVELVYVKDLILYLRWFYGLIPQITCWYEETYSNSHGQKCCWSFCSYRLENLESWWMRAAAYISQRGAQKDVPLTWAAATKTSNKHTWDVLHGGGFDLAPAKSEDLHAIGDWRRWSRHCPLLSNRKNVTHIPSRSLF